jgi:hypothetical protein
MKIFKKNRFSTNTIPIFIFGVSLIAFGVLTFNLGFFQDDWHHVYYYSQEGFKSLQHFLFLDGRPLAFIVYDSFFTLLGANTSYWHISLMILRCLAAVILWFSLNLLWEGFKKQNAFIALLFLVYPVYLLQPVAVSYTLHWAMYVIFMLSLLTMLLAARKPKFAVILTIASILLQVFHLLMIEYFIGIELLRPILLWIITSDQPLLRERVKQVSKRWIPYLAIAILFVIYRTSFQQLFGYERFSSMTGLALLATPLRAIPYFISTGLQDLTLIILSSWYETLKPALFEFTYASSILIWIAVLALITTCWIYFSALKDGEDDIERQNQWARQMIATGFAATLFGVLPAWAIGNTVYTSNPQWNDRFAMAAMLGAGMLWVGVICLFVPNPKHRYLLVSILVGLAVGINLRTQFDYKYVWEKQTNFYWELYWRAPYITPKTALISDGEIFSFMGIYPTSFAINTLYPKTSAPPALDYWFYSGYERMPSWKDFRAGVPLEYNKYASQFNSISTDSLAMLYEPENQQCLWILRPEDKRLHWLNPANAEVLPVSAVDRIQRTPRGNWAPPASIFGTEPRHTWCYYFEKADLARQYKDWQGVIDLWEESQKKDFAPGNGVEFIPFIEGYAYNNDWADAMKLTFRAAETAKRMREVLCDVWMEIESKSSASPERDTVLHNVYTKLTCGK